MYLLCSIYVMQCEQEFISLSHKDKYDRWCNNFFILSIKLKMSTAKNITSKSGFSIKKLKKVC